MSEYELSTRLFGLRRQMAEHHSGLVLTADDIVQLTGQLKTFGVIAQRNEHELRRLHAVENVTIIRGAAAQAEAVIAAAGEPGSNVHLLTIEQPFSDGRPS